MTNQSIITEQIDIDLEKQKKHWGWVCKMNQASFIPNATKYMMIKMLINEAFKHAIANIPLDEHEKLKQKYMLLKDFIDVDMSNKLSPTEILCKLSKLRLFTNPLEPSLYNFPQIQQTIPMTKSTTAVQKRIIEIKNHIRFLESEKYTEIFDSDSDSDDESEIET